MPSALARWMTAEATSRTWVTPPGTPSTSAEPMVCTESTTSRLGRTCSTWVSRGPPGRSRRRGTARRGRHRCARRAAVPGRPTPRRRRRGCGGPAGPTGRPARAAAWTCRRRARRRAAARRRAVTPPPSTRSSSPMPEEMDRADSTSTWVIGRAGVTVGGRGRATGPGGGGGDVDRAPGLALAAGGPTHLLVVPPALRAGVDGLGGLGRLGSGHAAHPRPRVPTAGRPHAQGAHTRPVGSRRDRPPR